MVRNPWGRDGVTSPYPASGKEGKWDKAIMEPSPVLVLFPFGEGPTSGRALNKLTQVCQPS